VTITGQRGTGRKVRVMSNHKYPSKNSSDRSRAYAHSYSLGASSFKRAPGSNCGVSHSGVSPAACRHRPCCIPAHNPDWQKRRQRLLTGTDWLGGARGDVWDDAGSIPLCRLLPRHARLPQWPDHCHHAGGLVLRDQAHTLRDLGPTPWPTFDAFPVAKRQLHGCPVWPKAQPRIAKRTLSPHLGTRAGQQARYCHIFFTKVWKSRKSLA